MLGAAVSRSLNHCSEIQSVLSNTHASILRNNYATRNFKIRHRSQDISLYPAAGKIGSLEAVHPVCIVCIRGGAIVTNVWNKTYADPNPINHNTNANSSDYAYC